MYSRLKQALTSVALMVAIVTPTVIESRAIAQTPRIRASAVLTSANGQNLTQEMINDAIAFGEFLAGEKFTPSEVSWFKDLAVKGFPKETASEIQGYNIIAKVLSEIRQLNNPVVRVQVREKLFTQIYLNQLAKGTLNEPGIMTIVSKHSPVIAADPTSKLVVTKRGFESYFEWYNFTEQLLGRPLLTNQAKAEALLEFPKHFHNIPLENKMMLAAAESHWLNLQQVWSKSSREYKLQKIAQLREIAKNPKALLPFSFINIALGSQIYQAWRNNGIPAIPQLPPSEGYYISPATPSSVLLAP
ncbi:hypothetical protein NIES4073_49060 [Kalymmatonema gypsitolerans NIES-4073]|nr:hypothetical protein NIES4073_49060 [Scytonema sp. NIES-4073]